MMAKLKIQFALLVGLLSTGASLQAFTLMGPLGAEAFQTPALGYNSFNFEIGGPMNLGEEYRWNSSVVTYAFDQSFLDFFGSNGVAAVESAIQIYNDLPPYSQMSSNLSEFPQQTYRQHFQAGALGLLDLKSMTMSLLTEQLGLTSPERFVWTLRNRSTPTINNVQTTNYVIIQRNFDPVTWEPSAFVNGVLYTYVVDEFSNPNFADAVEIPVGAPSFFPNSVASGANSGGGNAFGGLPFGTYYTGLTRDDVGGFRYLYRTNNFNVEQLLSDMSVAVTNSNTLNLLTTTNLFEFLDRTVDTTNAPADVLALYPNLQLTSTSAVLRVRNVTNITTFFTNSAPGGAATNPVFTTNIVEAIETNFNYSFGNVILVPTNSAVLTNLPVLSNLVQANGITLTNSGLLTNHLVNLATNGFIQTNTILISSNVSLALRTNFVPGLGAFVTNTTVTSTVTNRINGQQFIGGEIYFIPNNLLDFQVVSTQLRTTNTLLILQQTNTLDFGTAFPFTNRTVMEALTNMDLNLLNDISVGTTLDPVSLLALFPDLLITTTNQRLTNIVITNFVGDDRILTPALTNVFDYTLGNVVVTQSAASAQVIERIIDVVPKTFVEPGESPFTTNLISTAVLTDTNLVTGNWFIVPTNLLGYEFVTEFFQITQTNEIDFIFEELTNLSTRFVNSNLSLVVTGLDLSLLSEQALTNTPAAFRTLHPDILILQTNTFFTNEVTTIITNGLRPGSPFDPVGVTSQVTLVTNFTTNVVQRFTYSFGNVLTNPLGASPNVSNIITTIIPGFTNTVTNITAGVTNTNTVVIGGITNIVITVNPSFTNIVTNTVASSTNTFTNVFFTDAAAKTMVGSSPGTNREVELRLTELYQDPFTPAGVTNFITNSTSTSEITNFVSGSALVVPTNLFGYQLVRTQLVTITNATNVVFSVPITNNSVAFTNTLHRLSFITNTFYEVFPIQFLSITNQFDPTQPGRYRQRFLVTTNTVFGVYPIESLSVPVGFGPNLAGLSNQLLVVTNTTFAVNDIVFQGQGGTNPPSALRGGVDKVTFQRVDFDSLLGQTFQPVTNIIHSSAVSDGTNDNQFIRRISTAPDILFLAEDIGLTATVIPTPLAIRRTAASAWDNNNGANGNSALAGPGVIQPGIEVRYNKIGPGAIGTLIGGTANLDETEAFPYFIWASFDGTTNAPVIYPVGFTIEELESIVITNSP